MTLSKMDYWRLADELSVVDAAILITGNDPSVKINVVQGHNDPEWVQETDYEGFEAVFKALKNAVLSNRLAATACFKLGEKNEENSSNGYRYDFYAVLKAGKKLFKQRELSFWNHDALVFLETEPNWDRTLVSVEDLKSWLRSRQVFPEFFFPVGDPDSIMNQDSERYSAKLACAVAAWESVRRPTRSKTPKQTVEAWVTANGTKFGLANEDGLVPASAISEISKVVNWQPQGGAAKSGGEVLEPDPPEEAKRPEHYEALDVEEQEDGHGVAIMDPPF